MPLAASAEWTFPPWESFDVAGILDFTTALEYASVITSDDGEIDRLLGHPDPLQGDMQNECQLASAGTYVGDVTARERDRRSGRWRLLLQVDSHEEQTAMVWGTWGRIYFWITEDDLRARKWDAVWVVLQCS
jgi:uncharacterized protein YwqG